MMIEDVARTPLDSSSPDPLTSKPPQHQDDDVPLELVLVAGHAHELILRPRVFPGL